MITGTSKQGWWFGGDFRNLMPMGFRAAPPLWITPIRHHEQKATLPHLSGKQSSGFSIRCDSNNDNRSRWKPFVDSPQTKREAGNRGGV